MDAVGREGHAIVGADGAGQTEATKRAFEDGTHAVALSRAQPLAGEQKTRVLISQRERVAPDPVARPELPFEVRSPEIVRRVRGRGDDPGMMMWPTAAPLLHEPFPRQEIACGTHRGPCLVGDLRMSRRQPVEQLAGSPIRMSAPRGTQQFGDPGRNAVRTVMWGVAPIAQAASSVLIEAVEPLVARLATDAVAGAEFRPRVQTTSFVGDEAFALFHG